MAIINSVRVPNVAGSFYEADPYILQKTIALLFDKAKPAPKEMSGKPVHALIAPHAGYMYCGRVLASTYQLLKGRTYNRVLLIGPSHASLFHSMAFDTASFWRTPLGTVRIDKKSNEQFLYNEEFDVLPEVFDKEHSLEVHLPFLQHVLAPFSLIPLCTGQNLSHKLIAEKLSPMVTDKTLVVVSSDFSHYYPVEEAVALDRTSIEAILSKKSSSVLSQVQACGLEGIAILNELSIIKHWKPVCVDYQTSGDITGDMRTVVGYAGIAYV